MPSSEPQTQSDQTPSARWRGHGRHRPVAHGYFHRGQIRNTHLSYVALGHQAALRWAKLLRKCAEKVFQSGGPRSNRLKDIAEGRIEETFTGLGQSTVFGQA